MYDKIFKLVVVIALLCVPVGIPAYANDSISIFVSTDGNDMNKGTLEEPLATLQGAKDKIRDIKRSNNAAGEINVYFRAGDYRFADTVKFDAQDSGDIDSPITYQAYNDEKVSFVGGMPLDILKSKVVTDPNILKRLPSVARGKVLSYNFDEIGITRKDYGEVSYRGAFTSRNRIIERVPPVGEVYFNRQMMTLARYPNDGYLTVNKVVFSGGNVSDKSSQEELLKGAIFQYSDVHCDKWSEANDPKVYGEFVFDWGASSVDIKKINIRNRTIETKQAIPLGIASSGRYYVYNLLEEIDKPGEYYIDRESNVIYFYPPSELEGANVEISTLKKALIQLTDAKNITFQNITICQSRVSLINIEECENIKVSKCTLQFSSGEAVNIVGGRNNGVENCGVSYVENGISLGQSADRSNIEYLISSGNYVINNDIHNWGIISGRYTNAIAVAGLGDIISNNKIHDAVHQAIQIFGSNNIIQYNEFYNTNTDVDDSGCIYTGQNFGLRGNVIRYNYFHEINGKKMVMAVYLDDFFSGTRVYGNIFENISIGVFIHSGYDNNVENNIFVNCTTDVGSAGHGDTADFKPKITPPDGEYIKSFIKSTYSNEIWKKTFPKAVGIELTFDYLKNMRGNVVKNNISIDSGSGYETLYAYDLTLNKYDKSKIYSRSAVGFEDTQTKNYTLKVDSPVFKDLPKFEKIDFKKIGYSKSGFDNKAIENLKNDIIRVTNIKINNESSKAVLSDSTKKHVFLKQNSPIMFSKNKYSIINEDNSKVVPMVIDDKLLLPVNVFSQAMNASLSWNEDKTQLKMVIDSFNLELTVESDIAKVNNKEISLKALVKNIDSNLYIPARAFVEAIGKTIVWDDSGIIIITDKDANVKKEVIDYIAF